MDLSKDAEIDQLIASKKAEKEKRKKEQLEQGSVPEQPRSLGASRAVPPLLHRAKAHQR